MQRLKGVRSFDVLRWMLKWLAIVTMTVDHVGVILYPQHVFLRFVGRLAFPLFCYLIVLGIESTRNVRDYFLRLFFFAFASQLPYHLAFGFEPFDQLNIFFTLSSGVLFIVFYKKNSLLILGPILASVILNFEGGLYGVALVGCLHVLKKNVKLGVFAFFLINGLFSFVSNVQIFSFLALPIILLHNSGFLRMERKIDENAFSYSLKKYFFYIYYPLHLATLYLVKG